MSKSHQIEIGKLHAVLESVALHIGLVVDSITVDAQELWFQDHPFEARAGQPGSLEVFVGDENLAHFLNEKAPNNVRNFVLKSENGKLIVNASMQVLIELKAQAICTLRIVDRRYLYVDLERVNVLGAGATSLVQSQLDKLNPVLDVEDFPVRATLDEVQIVPGGVRLLGTVAPP